MVFLLQKNILDKDLLLIVCTSMFIYLLSTYMIVQGSYASGKFKFFQGQGIVREFYVVSGKTECFLKCQGILNFQSVHVSNDEKQKMTLAVVLGFRI